MNSKLIERTTQELLKKFGVGMHKPGSGSAAALQGMLSAQLLSTVVSLTDDENRRARYEQWLPELRRIDSDIERRIYPELETLFQLDSDQFDEVVELREARDKEKYSIKKKVLADQAVQALIPATESIIQISTLSMELAKHAVFVFDHGFKSARGDSSVA